MTKRENKTKQETNKTCYMRFFPFILKHKFGFCVRLLLRTPAHAVRRRNPCEHVGKLTRDCQIIFLPGNDVPPAHSSYI